MDRAYYTWLCVLAGGAVLGVFIRPKAVVVVAVALFVFAIIGLVLSAAASHETLTWFFGLAGMAIPVVGAVATLGAHVGAGLRRVLGRRVRK